MRDGSPGRWQHAALGGLAPPARDRVAMNAGAWRGADPAAARFRPARGCGRLARMRLAIFDFDGTLADTRLNIVLTMRETMRELRLPVADEAAGADAIAATMDDILALA